MQHDVWRNQPGTFKGQCSIHLYLSALESFLDAGPFEASGAALLLNLAGRAMARPSTGGQGRAGGELDIVFVHAWRVLGGGQ